VSRAILDGEDVGFVKIHVREGTDRVLGATIVARRAGEMISEITLAIVAGVGMRTLARVIHASPIQAGAIKVSRRGAGVGPSGPRPSRPPGRYRGDQRSPDDRRDLAGPTSGARTRRLQRRRAPRLRMSEGLGIYVGHW
jgi:hypothetical protein